MGLYCIAIFTTLMIFSLTNSWTKLYFTSTSFFLRGALRFLIVQYHFENHKTHPLGLVLSKTQLVHKTLEPYCFPSCFTQCNVPRLLIVPLLSVNSTSSLLNSLQTWIPFLSTSFYPSLHHILHHSTNKMPLLLVLKHHLDIIFFLYLFLFFQIIDFLDTDENINHRLLHLSYLHLYNRHHHIPLH